MSLTYGPEELEVRPTDPSQVSVLTWFGEPALLASPVVVDAQGRVSFRVAEGGRYIVKAEVGPATAKDTVDLFEGLYYDITDPRSYADVQGGRYSGEDSDDGILDPTDHATVAYVQAASFADRDRSNHFGLQPLTSVDGLLQTIVALEQQIETINNRIQIRQNEADLAQNPAPTNSFIFFREAPTA